MKKKRFSLIGICLLVFLLLSVSACQDNSGVESTRSVSPKPVSSQTPGGQTQIPSWIVTGAPKETPTIDFGHVQTFDIPTDDPTATATPTQEPTQTPSTFKPIVLPPVWFDR